MIPALLAVASGVVLAAALPPAGWWPLALALAVPFSLAARSERPRGAFVTGAAFAVGFFGVYIAWLPLSFSEPGLLGPAFWLLHPFLLAILAVMWGLTTAAARVLGGRGAGTLWVLPPLWVTVEHLRSTGYFAFPWGTLGYVWLDAPVGQIADAVGVTGLSLLTAAAAALVAAPWAGPAGGRESSARRRPAAARAAAGPLAAVALVGVAWLAGAAASGRHEVALDRTALLVQGNVDPFGRAVSAAQELEVHLELTRLALSRMAAPPDLVIWPEGATTGSVVEGAQGAELRERVQATAPASAFLVGGRARVPGGGTNSAFSIAAGQLIDRYDKHVLVPFGERWPLLETLPGLYRAVFDLLNLPMLANTVPGPGPAVTRNPAGALGVGICYESVFPTTMAGMVRDGADVLVIVTNDAWFARGDGARQHLDMGRLRAIEARRWLLRAGNDGITAVVDPYGRVVAELDRGVAATLAVRFGASTRETFYVRHADRVPWAVALLALLAVPVARRGRA